MDTRVALEAPDHRIPLQIIDQREHDHPLVVGHVGLYDGDLLTHGEARRGEVGCFVKTVHPQHAQPFEALHILENCARAQRQSEQRSVGGDDQVICQTALVTQPRHPKGAVLIELVGVKAVVSRF